MSDALSWMPLAIGRDLGWTLIYFVWQGLLLAALLYTVMPLCRSAIARHNCALATLVLMAVAPVVTFLSLHGLGRAGGAALSVDATAGPLASLPAPWMNGLVILWLAGMAALSCAPWAAGIWPNPWRVAIRWPFRPSSSSAAINCNAAWRWRGRSAFCCRTARMCRW